jgi:hypothetical protein
MVHAKTVRPFQNLMAVPLSDEERDSQTITPEHVGLAVSAMHRDGIVVLDNAVNVSHIDTLNSILSPQAEVMAKLPTTHDNDVSRPAPLLFPLSYCESL